MLHEHAGFFFFFFSFFHLMRKNNDNLKDLQLHVLQENIMQAQVTLNV